MIFMLKIKKIYSIFVLAGLLSAGVPQWMNPYFEYDSESKDSRYLFESVDIEYDNTNQSVSTNRTIIYLGNQHDIDNNIPYSFYFDNMSKLKNIEIFYKIPGKKVVRVKQKELKESEGIGIELYSDHKFLTWYPNFLVPGSVVGIGYTRIDFAPQYVLWIPIQDTYPIDLLEIDFHYPEEWYSVFTLLNDVINTGLPSKIPLTQLGRLTIELINVPKLKPFEIRRLPKNDRPILYCQLGVNLDNSHPKKAHENWGTLGAAFYKHYYAEKIEYHPGIDSLVTELTSGMNSDYVKINSITQWVQKNIRYVAVEIGDGGFRPYPADQTFYNKYGDCKDKANLLNTMLAYAGINALPVLIHTRGNWLVEKRIPGNQFNHAITAIEIKDEDEVSKLNSIEIVNRKYVLFDPTNPIVPFGQLPEYDEGVRVLVLESESGHLIESTSRSFNDNQYKTKITYDLKESGEISGELYGEYVGQSAYDLIRTLKEEGSFKEIAKGFILPYFSGSTINVYDIEQSDSAPDTVKFNISFEVPVNGKYLKKVIPFEINQYNTNLSTYDEDKASNVYFDSPYHSLDSVIVNLDDNVKIVELPENIHYVNDLGEYHAEFTSNGNNCIMATQFSIFNRFIPKEKYSQLRELYDIRYSGEKSILFLENN